jgi:hypothetical protein
MLAPLTAGEMEAVPGGFISLAIMPLQSASMPASLASWPSRTSTDNTADAGTPPRLAASVILLPLRPLSIEESSLFEGSSQRVENATDLSPSVDAKACRKKTCTVRLQPPLPSINVDL